MRGYSNVETLLAFNNRRLEEIIKLLIKIKEMIECDAGKLQ